MEWWKAAILGIVEGITEYLPVSSTGHLILAERALGLQGEAANAFAICIQAGAIVAVLQLYRGRVAQGIAGVLGKDADGRTLTINLIAAFAPAAVLGLTFDDKIEELLFGLWPVVTAWAVGGVGILAWTRFGRAWSALSHSQHIDCWKASTLTKRWRADCSSGAHTKTSARIVGM